MRVIWKSLPVGLSMERLPRLLVLFCTAMWAMGPASPGAFAQEQPNLPRLTLKPYHPTTPSRAERQEWTKRSMSVQGLPPGVQSVIDPVRFAHWFFSITSGRDGNPYSGVMVGGTALGGGGGTTSTPVQIIPVIVKTVSVGTAIDPLFGTITTSPGNTTFDPTVADPACLTSTPTKVPVKLLKRSPLFKKATFNFGGTDVGFTQYGDAVQRAQFWNTIDQSTYHVLLGPVTKLAPLTLNVPAPGGGTGGLALDAALFGSCGRMAVVNVDLIDSFVTGQFAALAAQGVGPSTFPIFAFYNTAFALGDPTNLLNCCAGGYHNAVDVGNIQTYSVVDFDMTGAFGVDATDTGIASHEVAEWMNDPLGTNPTPSWGQGTCQSNLEVADPLIGNGAPRIFMPAPAYTYHLQEEAYFSWFFGAVDAGPPSIGLNGWFSTNATFLTDAGPPCI